jgi:hypothetical protein
VALLTNGYRAAGARIHLDDVHHVIFDGKLDVHQAAHAQRQPQLFGVILDDAQVVEADFVGRQHTGAVARMNARFFDVLHDASHHHALAVGQGIYVYFIGILNELVDEHRVARRNAGRFGQKGAQGIIVVGDGHGATTENEGRPYQHRIANLVHHLQRLLHRVGQPPGRMINLQPVQQLAKSAAIFGQVNAVGRRTPDGTPRRPSPAVRLIGVWPPNCTITPSGCSKSTMLSTSSRVSGSK